MPDIRTHRPKVKLVGTDGNAFALLAKCSQVLRKAGYSHEECERFRKEATEGDYNHLLRTCSRWCDVS